MTWKLSEMSLGWKVAALVGSLAGCIVVLGGAFKLLKLTGIM